MKMKFCKSLLSLSLILKRRRVSPTMLFCQSPPTTTSTSTTIRSSSSSNRNTSGGMLKSRSEDNLKKLGDCMDNMDDDVTKLFIEFQETDLREDPELFRLLNRYFITSKGVSHLCESLKTCLDRADKKKERRLHLIDEALRDFDEEKLSYKGFMEASFRKTFRDLSNLKNDSSSGCDDDYREFLSKFQSFHEDLVKMIVELEKTMKDIDKRLKRVRGRRAFLTVALLAPVIVAIFVSKVVAGVFGFVPLDALTSFVASRWKKSTEALKRQKTAISSMERATTVALKEVDKITKLVTRLESVERSIRLTAEFATSTTKKRSSLVASIMGEVEEERDLLESTLLDLDRETGQCDGFAQFGRTVALEKITEFVSRGQKISTR